MSRYHPHCVTDRWGAQSRIITALSAQHQIWREKKQTFMNYHFTPNNTVLQQYYNSHFKHCIFTADSKWIVSVCFLIQLVSKTEKWGGDCFWFFCAKHITGREDTPGNLQHISVYSQIPLTHLLPYTPLFFISQRASSFCKVNYWYIKPNFILWIWCAC